MNRLKKFWPLLVALALAAGLSVAGCGSSTSVATPATWTVSYAGTVYCPYEYTPYETQMYGYTGQCTPVVFPSVSLVPTDGLGVALMTYWTTYSAFYESDYWYYHYYAPINTRLHVHITVIPHNAYMSNVSTFDHTYSRQVSRNSKAATYVGKNGKRTTKAPKFPTTNAKQAQQITSKANQTAPKGSGSAGYNKPPTVKAPSVKTRTGSGGFSTRKRK